MREDIIIRPERKEEYKEIAELVLQSFRDGTEYSDGIGEVALIDEIRASEYYLPELSFAAELDGKIVGHFMFSKFPLSETAQGGHGGADDTELVMLAPVAVRIDYLRQKIGSTMLKKGIEEVKKAGYRGITVEGNFRFYNLLGFSTSSEYGIYPTSGIPMEEPRCMMCQECYEGAMKDIRGYVVYDMYENA